jgi:hypothetical protein
MIDFTTRGDVGQAEVAAGVAKAKRSWLSPSMPAMVACRSWTHRSTTALKKPNLPVAPWTWLLTPPPAIQVVKSQWL